ncbi:MAG: ParB N-terminal domain-containing protein, partial [Phycisphaerae bacterium]|nr:ParB N-terminal domain-containing protein [Phycisphaerae bacterium]
MNVQQRPLTEIKPYEKNPRINDAAVDGVAASIQQFGFRQPIVVDTEGVIVCGHTRWKAAQKLGLTEVPVHVATDLTPEQIRAYRLADNKTAELAEWNLELLPIELAELQGAGIDWSLLGFDADELATLLDPGVKAGLTDPDEVPEPPDEAITQPGDLWILGEHRLLCGDSASAADLDRLLDGAPIHLVNTDPPYNVKVEPRSKNAVAAGLATFAAYLSDEVKAREAKKRMGNHQRFDLARDPSKAKPATQKMRAKDRPL